ncbi:MAG: substrate-binding domain-containing protein [Fusobacteriaceae bacterium]|jgi:ribose transport system substrate-binding protein|nr:substrate-binding domain-containing protein [Fusobacteriaceae bacterium]
MKKFISAILMSAALFLITTSQKVEAKALKFALITMDSIDSHWITLNEGAQAAAKELGVTVDFKSPNTKDDAQQIEMVNNAIASKYDAILIAANGPDAISGALKEAQAAGIKIIYVDSPANVPAEATFSTNNKAGGKTAGELLRKTLEGKGVKSGKLGIVNVNTATQSTVDREAGFREAFAGSGFTILETQYSDGDAAKAQEISQNYITQGVVGIFGANEGSTAGTGNALKAAGKSDILGIGFDVSDAIKSLVSDGYLLATMKQNPDVMGDKAVRAAVDILKNGKNLGGEVVDTGVSVLDKSGVK